MQKKNSALITVSGELERLSQNQLLNTRASYPRGQSRFQTELEREERHKLEDD